MNSFGRFACLLIAALLAWSGSMAASNANDRVLARAICFGQGLALETYVAENQPDLNARLEIGPQLALRPLSLALVCLQSTRQSALAEHVRQLGQRPETEFIISERLLRMGAKSVYQEPDLGAQTPLHLVLALPLEQHKELLELLLRFDGMGNLALRDAQGLTPADLALRLSPGLAQALARYQPSGLSDFNLRFEAFAFAAGSRQLDRFRQQEALLTAISRQQPQVAENLLQAGVSPDLYLLDPVGRPLLQQLALTGRQDWIERLIKHGADLRMRDFEQREVLHLLAAEPGAAALLSWLAAQGASIHSRDAQGESPLFAAVRAGQADNVAALLSLKADPELKNHQGISVSALARDLAAKDPSRFAPVAALVSPI